MYSLLSMTLGKLTLYTSLKLKQIIARFQAHLQLLDISRQLCKIEHVQAFVLQALVLDQPLPPLGHRGDQPCTVMVCIKVIVRLSPQDVSPQDCYYCSISNFNDIRSKYFFYYVLHYWYIHLTLGDNGELKLREVS